jgi:hypothetical protein
MGTPLRSINIVVAKLFWSKLILLFLLGAV